MKSRTRPAALLAAMLLITPIIPTGCAIFGIGEPARMTATLQSVRDDYNEAQLELEATQGALNELVVAEPIDLAQAYDVFRERAETMLRTGERLVVHGDGMHFQGASYLVESDSSGTACVYPRLRRPEDKPAADLAGYFDPIADDSWEVKRAWRAYQFDIRQLRNYLWANLTPLSVDTMTQIFRKANADSDSLMYALEQALAAVDRAKAAKTQVRR